MNIFDNEEISYKDLMNELNKIIISQKIIKSVKKSFSFTDEPKFFQFYSELIKKFNKGDSGSCLSINENKAKIKAIAETIERYSLGEFKKKDLIKTSYNKDKRCVDPSLFLSFSEKQIGEDIKIYKKKLREFLFYWTEGYSLFDHKKILIPTQLVYVPYYMDKEVLLRHPISTGAAFGSSLAGALYRGICEVVERDAFMITYLNKLKAPRIDLENIQNKQINSYLTWFKKYFLELYVFDITTDIKIPTVLCIILDKSGVGPALSFGAKADINYIDAVIGAIEEAQNSRVWIRYLKVKRKNIKNIKEINEPEDRAIYWYGLKRINNFDFLLKNKKTKIDFKKFKRINKTRQKLKEVLKILKKNKKNIFFVNLTPKEIKKYGFKVVKAIIPKMQPLYLYEDFKYLGEARLYNIPVILGYRKVPEKESKLNKVPHPFV